MTVLQLGPCRRDLIEYMESFGDEVKNTEQKLSGDSEILDGVDLVVSYGYRHILKKNVLNRFPRRIINLHISLLPFNRGTDPNLWSFLEDTPKGVTIHYIAEGVDTGDVLAQQGVTFPPDATLRSTYEELSRATEDLFREVWPEIRSGRRRSFPQPEGGSCHRMRDRARFEHLLTQGWDTPVAQLTGKALQPV